MFTAEQAKKQVEDLNKADFEMCKHIVKEKITKAIEERKLSVDIYEKITPEVQKYLAGLGYQVLSIPSGPNEYTTKISWGNKTRI